MTGPIAMRQGWRRAAAALLAALPMLAPAAEQHPHADVPFIPTPPAVVDAMLELAGVGPQDTVVDLGSGDGRIVIAAARQRGARGFGVEIDGDLVEAARREARRAGVAGRVEFKVENLFSTNLVQATVVTMYLYPRLMMQLRPRLFAELKPGSRVVSHDFDMAGWQPDARVTVPVPGKPYGPPSSEVYLWILPANASGAWKWRASDGGNAVDHELTLHQTFQMLDGSAVVGGRPGRVEGGRMRGDEIRFILTAEVGGRLLRHEFRGRVDGDAINGTVSVPGGERDWKAARVKRGSIKISDE